MPGFQAFRGPASKYGSRAQPNALIKSENGHFGKPDDRFLFQHTYRSIFIQRIEIPNQIRNDNPDFYKKQKKKRANGTFARFAGV